MLLSLKIAAQRFIGFNSGVNFCCSVTRGLTQRLIIDKYCYNDGCSVHNKTRNKEVKIVVK